MVKYDDASLRAELWNCPTPSELVCPANLSWFLFRKMLGFFWCEVGLCKPIHSVPKNNKVIFFLYWNHFREELLSGYSNIMFIVSPTTGLTRVPYNLFGKLLFSHFHTEPLSREELFQKSCKSVLLPADSILL